jgi:hypothetical protein
VIHAFPLLIGCRCHGEARRRDDDSARCLPKCDTLCVATGILSSLEN